MLVSAAITHIRNRTGHDVDGQVNDTTMLLPWIEHETRLLRRDLSLKVPELYTVQSPAITVLTGERIELTSTTGPYERVVSVQRRTSGSGADSYDPSSTWVDLPQYEEGSPYAGYRIDGPWLIVSPERLNAGVYRVRYIMGIAPAAFTTSTELNGDVAGAPCLPIGLEQVVIERVCASVCTRVPGDDPAPHTKRADDIWATQLRALRMQYGRSVKPGFRRLARFA